jgi:hypothetical protein
MNWIWAFGWASGMLIEAGLITGPPPKIGGIFGARLVIRPASINRFTEAVIF